ncbi:MAG TPA: DnaB-like helicase C-terminal domain-containing protein, partial [Myxococcota bacterium]|nr:DnaB-like helicase C-terminal domain-containing protein [Myxococcota bacterium]
ATAANVVHHARIVRVKAVKRNLIRVATEIVETSFDQAERSARLLASEGQVNFTSFRKGYGSADAYRRIQRAANSLAGAQIWMDDTGTITILEIKAKCRRLMSEHGLDLVMLDYLQLAHGNAPVQRKDLEIAEISHGLKSLAKELDVPVIALSQLNRGPEQRDPDKRRPNMGDLRESGAIEQDADVIGFIYRDEVYNPNEENRGVAELIIAKQRNGPTDTVKLHFDAQYARFRDFTGEPADGSMTGGGGGSRRGPDRGSDDDDAGGGFGFPGGDEVPF